jgi:ankyrin repeat protein
MLMSGLRCVDMTFRGETALHHATLADHTECIEMLLWHGARPDVGIHPPIGVAASMGYAHVLTMFLNSCPAAANARDVMRGTSPLHHACEYGHLSCVQLLLNCGASINMTETIGSAETPLHRASRHGCCKVIRCLLQHGADPVLGEPLTPLYYAASLGNIKATRELLHCSPDTLTSTVILQTAEHHHTHILKIMYDMQPQCVIKCLGNVVEIGIESQRRDLLEFVFSYCGIEINRSLTRKGKTALHLAMVKYQGGGEGCSCRIIKWFLRKGADPHAPDHEGRTPIDYLKGDMAKIRKLFH